MSERVIPIVGRTISRTVFRSSSYRDRIIEWGGKPGTIRVDNGPEFLSGKLLIRAENRDITIRHIQPGQPQQNAYALQPHGLHALRLMLNFLGPALL